MTADIVGFGLTVHGTVCAGSVVAIWKLHGESKFGKQPQEEMTELRGKILRSISQSLVETFEPILTLEDSLEISQIIMAERNTHPRVPKITTKGKEILLNAVRDFVKSDIEMLKSLRSLDCADSCVTHSLVWLRRLTLASAVFSGVFLVLAALVRFAVLAVESPQLHVVGFVIVGALLCSIIAFVWRVSHSVNVLAKLKENHADLS